MSNFKKDKIKIGKISISLDGTHHIYNGKPLYKKTFKSVMSFHLPGVSAVLDDSGAYHINLKGNPVYKKRFLKSFGYYDGIAAVSDTSGWYHINIEGKPIYKERFNWVGNFQEGKCSVQNKSHNYFHIKRNGNPLYDKRYKYVGDFKYGIAVVYEGNGYARHIDINGNFIHFKKYQELGIYHKGFATARDSRGAFHIDKNGNQLYDERYLWVEPFYNGFAFVCKKSGEKLIIDESGKVTNIIYDQQSEVIQKNLKKKLKGMLVGYWKTQIIYSIVKFEILDKINLGFNSFEVLKNELNIPEVSLNMILKVLKLWNFITERNDHYSLNYLGYLLTEDFPDSLKYAALMWGDEHYRVMAKLFDALKSYKAQFKKIYGLDVFRYFNENKEKGIIFNRAMNEYSSDYDEFLSYYDFSESKIILDVGGGHAYILKNILKRYPNIKNAIIFDLPTIIEDAKFSIKEPKIKSKIKFVAGNFLDDIPLQADTIILSRILHDWNDNKAFQILKNVENSLLKGGTLLLFETIVPEKCYVDKGITLNFNLLVCTGGKERTLLEFQNLLEKANLEITSTKQSNGIISLIVAQKKK
jgi:hypothetical protein